MDLVCPVCGNKLRTINYKFGGGQVDCFTCRTSVRVLPHHDGLIISKHIFQPYSETDRYRGPELSDLVYTETRLPFLSGNIPVIDRQMTKEEVTA